MRPTKIRCGKCGNKLLLSQVPCPFCGCNDRIVEASDWGHGSEGIVDVQESRLLSPFFLQLAKKTLDRCKRTKGKGEHLDILAVYILVVASLESFINEVCIQEIERREETGENTKCLKEIIYGNGRRGLEIRGKWQAVAMCLHSKNFDKGLPPWQDFDRLVDLRNSLLHYRSELSELGYVPKFLISLFRSLGLLAARRKTSPLKEGSWHWTRIICTLTMGEWAFKTGVNMMFEFLATSDEDTVADYKLMLERLRIRPIKG